MYMLNDISTWNSTKRGYRIANISMTDDFVFLRCIGEGFLLPYSFYFFYSFFRLGGTKDFFLSVFFFI